LECAERPPLPDDFIWIPEADIEQYGVPRLVELLLEAVAKYDNK
jgi:A/G-specific adenine glycosylase